MTLTPEGIAKGWQVERMLGPRVMPEAILLPNGKVMIINGASTGYSSFNTTYDSIDLNSNADHAV